MKQPKPESPLQKFVCSLLAELVDSNKEFEEKTGITHNMLSNYQAMYNYMGIDKLEKIFSAFPEIQTKVAQFLSSDKIGASNDIMKMFEKLEKSYVDVQELWKILIKDKNDTIQSLRDELDNKRKKKTRPSDE